MGGCESTGFRLWAVVLAVLVSAPLSVEAAKKKAIPVVTPVEKPEPPKQAPAADPGEAGALFEEIEFGSTLVIEGKVEKPQVQFTLLKEPPPEKEIRFETSFLQNILKQERENTFNAAERYGRD